MPTYSDPGTPQWWLDTLVDELNRRRTTICKLRNYMDGMAPLPEGAEDVREAYRKFQKMARYNLAETVVEAVSERMVATSIRTGKEGSADKEAQSIWDSNDLALYAPDVHTDMLALGAGYVIVGPPDEYSEHPVITREDPELVITAHDPKRPSRVIAALKMYHEPVTNKDFAYLYLPGVVHRYWRNAHDRDNPLSTKPDVSSNAWTLSGSDVLPEGMEDVVPVVKFENRRAQGEFETHLDLLDRINYITLQRLVIAAMQAYRQRALKGDMDDTDELGNDVDYGALFRPGAGSLWRLPEGVELWESQTADITPLVDAAKSDIRDLAAVTRTPLSMLIPDSANQSAEGALASREGLVTKAADRIQRADMGWSQVLSLAFMYRGTVKPREEINISWANPALMSLNEKADAASKATNIPWRFQMSEIWGFDPDLIDRMEVERNKEMLMAQMMQPAPQPGQTQNKQTGQQQSAANQPNSGQNTTGSV